MWKENYHLNALKVVEITGTSCKCIYYLWNCIDLIYPVDIFLKVSLAFRISDVLICLFALPEAHIQFNS